MKKSNLIQTIILAGSLLLCAWPGVGTAQAAPGSVLEWGGTYSGQTPVPVAAQSGVTAIAAGDSHTVALKSDGSVLSWGHYSYSFLDEEGSGTVGDYNFGQTTVPVAAQSGVTAVAAGAYHTVALKSDGGVLAWRPDGHSTAYFRSSPSYDYDEFNYGQTVVPVAAQSGVTAIAAGWGHTVALKNDGSVVAWGHNDSGQTTVPVAAQSGVTAITAGSAHTVALKNDGSVVAWGDNYYGQTTVPVAAQSGVTAIAAGSSHTVALKSNGSVLAWGDNNYGQTNVPVAAQSGVTAIAAGFGQTVALLGTAPPPPPQLTIIRSGANVILTWPANAAGFALHSTTNLFPTAWSPVAQTVVTNAGQISVTVPTTVGRKYFRLKSP